MARTLFLAFLAVCLVCVLQASPLPGVDQEPSPTNVVQDLTQHTINAVQHGLTAVHQQVTAVANDENLHQIAKDLEKLLEAGVKAAHDSLGTIIPKTTK